MSFRWKLTIYLIVFFISVCVDGRFRRLASGLYGSSSLSSSGGWRLIKPEGLYKDYSSSNDGLSSSPLSSLINNQRHQTINPLIHTNHWRLPFKTNHYHHGYKNHLETTDLPEDELDSTIGNNNQGENLDQQSRLTGNYQHNPLTELTSVNREDHETTEKTLDSQIIIPSSVVPNSQSNKLRVNLGSPESLLGEEVLSRSASSVSTSSSPSSSVHHQIHYANKKIESESAHEGSPMVQYRSFNHGNRNSVSSSSFSDLYFVAIVVGSSGLAIFAVVSAGYCFYRFQQHNKSAADVDYPAYGVVGPITKETSNPGNLSPIGDRKLAQSAQMYHYHHQKQQMIASEKVTTSRHTSASDVDSEEENEEGDYTVYECPGLASTGEMEVKNPLFQDDITPVSSPSVITNGSETKDKK